MQYSSVIFIAFFAQSVYRSTLDHARPENALSPSAYHSDQTMAIVLRSNTDLVYLPDHGFVGEEGGKYYRNDDVGDTMDGGGGCVC